MTQERIAKEDLAAALAEPIAPDGTDRRLVERREQMSKEELEQSEENVRRWIENARGSLASTPSGDGP